MKTLRNHKVHTPATMAVDEFITFNRLLKTMILQGHLVSENLPASGRLLTFIHQQLSSEEVLRFVIRLDEMNMPTTKMLFDVFKAARSHTSKQIRVCWFCSYKDQQMIETGLDLGELFGVEVTILPV